MQKSHGVVINEEEVTGTRKALVISVSDYSTSNLQDLEFCKNDGEDMYELLKSLGYEIPGNHKLVGQVRYDTVRDAIFDFFDNTHTRADDTLIFYYSGHGVPDTDGDVYLATSEVDPDAPYRRGFSFNELTRMMNKSVSTRIVSVLDCCYSGAAKISKGLGKGGEEAAAKLGTAAINDKSTNLQKDKGICLLAASQAAQEAYALKEGDHSIFTYYLLEGLKGNKKSVDGSGKVTADTLGKYVHRAIVNLPPEKRPKQTPIRKIEVGDEIVLAHYPKLAEKPVVDIAPIIFEGIKYVNNENYSKAIELYDEAIKLNPKSHVGHVYKGYALLKLKKYDEAITCYNVALEINSKEIDALKYKGLSLSNLSKYNEAIQCYDAALEIDPMDSKVWYYKGSALSQLSKYNEAIKCYTEAIKINPEYNDPLRDKGLLEKFAKVVVEEKEPAPLPRADISLILDEGSQYFENGDYDNAIKSFDKAMSLNPKNPIPYNHKGDVLFKLKKYEEAIKSYDAALEINPKYLDVLKDKALSLDNLGKHQEAINCFDAALEINPKIARNWYYKALSLSKLSNNEEAIRCYDEVLGLEPTNVDAWIGRGICLGILKKYKEAIECYDKAIIIDPNNAVAHEKKKAILQLISEETKSGRQQQQQSPIITPISSPSPIHSKPLPSQPPTSPLLHSHQPVATKDTSSSSPYIKEEHYSQPTTTIKKQQQPWTNPKILVPIIVAVVVIAAAVFFMMRPTPEINALPIASAGTDQILNAGNIVNLDGSKSSDSDGNSLTYSWKQTSGPTVTLNNANTAGPSFIAPIVSSDTVLIFALTVTDDKGSTSTDNIQVTVNYVAPANQLPVANAGQDQTVNAGDVVTLDGNASKDPDGNIITYSWIQIAGPAVTLNDASTTRPSFTAPRVSSDTQLKFYLTVKDDKGDTSSFASVTITVKAPAPASPQPTQTPPSSNMTTTGGTSPSQGQYSFIRAWRLEGIGNGEYSLPAGIAIDSSDNVYVADFMNSEIQVFGSNGDFFTKWEPPGSVYFGYPEGISIDSSGNMYVSNFINDHIQKVDSNGKLITAWGSTGSGNGQFDGAAGIAIDSSDNVYVADYINNRIQKFDSSGKFITKWGTTGEANGQLALPRAIAIDSSDNVYVADNMNNRIQKFDSSGKFITKWGTMGEANGQFKTPRGIAIDSSDNVYVSDEGNNRIQKFDSNGKFITAWGSTGSGNGQFNKPWGIAIGSSGNVYVADGDNDRIQVFAPNM
jgi:tetratricopeptide (TPR) repeat protein/streptogramin lyase